MPSSSVYISACPLSHIEHFLVAADDIDATRDWYARVLGMRSGPHPDFGFPVHWMYLGDVDVVHIGPSAKSAGDIQKKYLGRTSQEARRKRHRRDRPHRFPRHRAARNAGASEDARRSPSRQRRANGQALFQLFFYDPNGIKIELNYDAAEAEGIAPELMASDFTRR